MEVSMGIFHEKRALQTTPPTPGIRLIFSYIYFPAFSHEKFKCNFHLKQNNTKRRNNMKIIIINEK
jgi:hypothetical protein